MGTLEPVTTESESALPKGWLGILTIVVMVCGPSMVGMMLTDLPNMLTLSRIAAIPLLVALLALQDPRADFAASLLFGAACVTDYLDGHFARTRRQLSDFGRMLDPIADKLLVGATLMMLVGEAHLSAFGLYPAIVIMLREILVSGLREYLAAVRVGMPVTRLAKWKTGVQMLALGLLVAGNGSAEIIRMPFLPLSLMGEWLLWLAALLTLLTGWDYLTAGLRHAAAPVVRADPENSAAGHPVARGVQPR